MRGYQPDILRLFEDILRNGTGLRVRVTGRSMAPFLTGGEILTIKKVRYSSLQIGDLIFFKDVCGFPVLHRIIKKYRLDGRFTFHTKGDAVVVFDRPVDEEDVLGKACGIEKIASGGKTKYIDMESRFQKRINYLIAFVSFIRAKTYFAVLRRCKSKI
jgi:signal peptidase I